MRLSALSLLLTSVAASERNSLEIGEGVLHRKLDYESIAGYTPSSLITDLNAIDLDQQAIEVQVALGTAESFTAAKNIYEQGAFSQSIALLTIAAPLPVEVKKGTVLTAVAQNGVLTKGYALEDHAVGDTVVKFEYAANEIQANYVNCQVGGLPFPEQNRDGCLKNEGGVNIPNAGNDIAYTYIDTENNVNGRSIQRLSTNAQAEMLTCASCPYKDFAKFHSYYEDAKYADRWVQAALEGKPTNFPSGRGNNDFSKYKELGRSEAIKKGTAYMAVWMYVLRQLEAALDDCANKCTGSDCNSNPVLAWDQGVAYYTGSLEGKDGSGTGQLIYHLADKRCVNFRTCGETAKHAEGTSQVNIEIFDHFRAGRLDLSNRLCEKARTRKERIAELMAVPLVQGTLRYAYVTDKERNDVIERQEAEGAVFSASVLPIVHACNQNDAAIIWENMAVGSGPSNFREVKKAFERNYACMGIKCSKVGGLFDSVTGVYFEGGSPCSDSGVNKTAAIVGGVLGGVVLILIGVIACMMCKRRKGRDTGFTKGAAMDVPTDEKPPLSVEANGSAESNGGGVV